jgi:O-antigen ligase
MFKNILHYANIFGLQWTLCVCLFDSALLPRWLLYGGLYIFFTTWLIEFFMEKRWQTKPTKEWFFFGMLIAFFLWAFLYWPWDGAHTYFHHHMEQRLPLLGFGIVGLFGLNERYSRAAIIHTMAVVSVCSVIFLFCATGWEQLLSPERVTYLAHTRVKYLNAHMGYNFFLNATLIGLWWLLFHSDRKPALWQKVTYPICALVILVALLLSDGRSGFFMGLVILGMMGFAEIYHRHKWLSLGFSVFALAALLTVCTLHPRINTQKVSHDLRYCYWKSAIELIREKPVLGYGMSNAQEQFDQVNMKYAPETAIHYWTVLHHRYVDCHSQYIQTTLEFGFIGLILLLTIYLLPLWLCWRKVWGMAFFITLISMGQSLFDVFITGQFSIIYCLLFLMVMRMPRDYTPIAFLSSPSHAA